MIYIPFDGDTTPEDLFFMHKPAVNLMDIRTGALAHDANRQADAQRRLTKRRVPDASSFFPRRRAVNSGPA
jgi:hypothetical protein